MKITKNQKSRTLIQERTCSLRCPVCQETTKIHLDESILEKGEAGMVYVSIPASMSTCGHVYNVFVDYNFMIRGYQKVHHVAEGKYHPRENASTKRDVSLVTTPFTLSDEKNQLSLKLDEILAQFTADISGIEAIAVFTYGGIVLSKRLSTRFHMEEISVMAGSLMTQSAMMGRTLDLERLEHFTLTSEKYSVLVKKAGELLVFIIHDKTVRRGMMELHLNKLTKLIEINTSSG